MKYAIIIALGFLLAIGCRKESSHTIPAGSSLSNSSSKPYGPLSAAQISPVQKFLRDSLARTEYDSLEFTRIVVSSTDSGRTYFVRVPWIGVDVTRKFVLIQTNSAFQPGKASVIEITQFPLPAGVIPTTFSFSGSIRKSWLNGTLEYQSAISNGYILALHNKTVAIEAAKDPTELPEIIIYAPGEDYYADWLYITSGGGGGIGYSSSAPSSGSGGGGGGSAAAAATNSNSFNVANELQASKPAIVLAHFLACFATVPNAGATYSASLLVSIPNASNPSQMWNPLTGKVGHTFMQLTKTNGTASVTQYVGFYASCGICALSGDPTTSKMVDNSGHPYNASLTLTLDQQQFGTLTGAMQTYSSNEYALCNYNCTAYALDVFNSVMPAPLDPNLMTIPGGTPGEMPNGLYLLMQGMQTGRDPADIKFYSTPQTAGTSHGTCI